MISFDRRGNNLTAVWNEINSIKVDTYSLYTLITAGGGEVPEELLNSITLLVSNTAVISSDITSLNNNTSYFNNELYSLKTDTSSMVSDTASLNMDVVSLYNICSSLSDSISTITGGGGGGLPYYLNVSDVLASSLKYAYNVSGDILSLPYDSISLYGNLGNFINYAVPTNYSNIDISGLKTMESISLSGNFTTKYQSINLTVSEINKCLFSYITGFQISASKMQSCTLVSISNSQEIFNVGAFNSCSISLLRGKLLNAYMISDCTFDYITNTINANSITSCTFSHCNSIDASYIANNYLNNCSIVNAFEIRSCTFSDNWYNDVVNVMTFSRNAVNAYNASSAIKNYMPDYFKCLQFVSNSISHISCSKNFVGDNCLANRFQNSSGYSAKGYLNLSFGTFVSNSFSYHREITINPSTFQKNSFDNISILKINGSINEIQPKGNVVSQNAFNVITMLDVKDIDTTCTLHFNWDGNLNYLGVSTMKMNYSLLRFSTSALKIQPTNIYTLDFYNCDPWIVNSKFHIPDWFSGYDEANVWISGEPLVNYSYSLSTTTLS